MSNLKIRVKSSKVKYTSESIISEYDYQTTRVTNTGDKMGPQYNVSVVFFSFPVIMFILSFGTLLPLNLGRTGDNKASY